MATPDESCPFPHESETPYGLDIQRRVCAPSGAFPPSYASLVESRPAVLPDPEGIREATLCFVAQADILLRRVVSVSDGHDGPVAEGGAV